MAARIDPEGRPVSTSPVSAGPGDGRNPIFPRVPARSPQPVNPDAPAFILIPAFNEGHAIGALIEAIQRQQVDASIVVVDDGSTDDTAGQARRRGAVVITHPFNLGYGAALHTGYIYARRNGCKYLVQMDADGQHDPTSLPDLFAGLEAGADVVVGSRYLDSSPPPTSPARRIGSRLSAFIVTWWTRIRITDATSGYQAMSARALATIANDGFPEDYPDADMLITLARAGLKLMEVPVKMHSRHSGPSMHRPGRAAYYAYRMLLTLVLLPIRRPTPFRSADTVAQLHIP